MSKPTFFLLVFMLFIFPAFGSTINGKYNIEVAGIKIGNLFTSKSSKGNFTYYKLESKVSLWLFYHFIISHEMICVYSKKELQYVVIRSLVNKEHYSSHIERVKDHYDVHTNTYKDKNTKSIYESITFSVAKLFFEEPTTQKTILAENYGVMVPLKAVKPNVYQLVVINKTNKYTYENGELVTAEMESPIKNFIIRKVK
ncbi:MAG: hypothetical protein H7296_00620 [Bacteroidia bacterium]|nr:hypothetical protein [Bacteroidia bacterium]